jgi:hypothetical protein
VIFVKRDEEKGNVFHLKQRRFIEKLKEEEIFVNEDSEIWSIPIKILKQNGEIELILMREREMSVELEGIDKDSWIKLNSGI